MRGLEEIMKEHHWADDIAEDLISKIPDREEYVCAAGITPSGIVHIGNFRDLITSDFVVRAINYTGKKGKLIFVWDDFDRFRKVPQGVSKEFEKYFGMSISSVPDPYGCHESYANHFKGDFESTISELGLSVEFINQAQEYGKNRYYFGIKEAMQKREKIARILADSKTQGMDEDEIKNFYPLKVYCSNCEKDTTKITHYDGEDLVTYSCDCGNEKTEDISKRNIGKLQWKIDWSMRWKVLGINFEPGGKDHATEGGSYDVSSRIAREVFDIDPPYFQGYEFVGIKGSSKMSSSEGTGISPKDLLGIYDPAIIRWLFARVKPKSPLTFYFDSELIRQYDEFDRLLDKHFQGDLIPSQERVLFFSNPNPKREWPRVRVPFRQLASIGQIAQGNIPKLKEILRNIGQEFDEENLRDRLSKASKWVSYYERDMQINVRETSNRRLFEILPENDKRNVIRLREELDNNWNLESLTTLVYGIPKTREMSEEEKKVKQKEFFEVVYRLMIDKKTGPRLPTFILALGKDKVKKLLNFDL